MDPLSKLVDSLRVSGIALFRAEFTAPWGFDGPPSEVLRQVVMPGARGGRMLLFHVVRDGECQLWLDGQRRTLAVGDVAVIARGDGHRMADSPGRATIPVSEVLPAPDGSNLPPVISYGGGGATTRLLCGAFVLEGATFEPLASSLPPLIVASARDGAPARWLSAMFDGALDEAATGAAGSRSVLQRLTELFFVDVLRASLSQIEEERLGLLSALRDESVARAVGLLHESPARRWTVADLAKEVGLSRSSLAAKFKATIGDAPMQYLARWRLHLAADLLMREDLGVAATAARVGYDSEAAFTRAFRREFGQPPASWQRERRQSAD